MIGLGDFGLIVLVTPMDDSERQAFQDTQTSLDSVIPAEENPLENQLLICPRLPNRELEVTERVQSREASI